MFTKICGCRREEDVAAAAAAGASAVGLILAPGFRRSLGQEQAERVRAAVPAGVWAVGVFLAQPLDEVLATARALCLDAVQLHGAEADDYCARVRAACRVIRAWSGAGDPPAADVVLAEPHAGRAGGLGAAWDWSAAAHWDLSAPLLLSGGLDPDNVAAACAAARPWGVDVSSGVEACGVKDPERIAAFCAAVRGWEEGRRAR